MSRCFNSLPDSELCFSNQIRCRLWFIIVAPLAHQSFRYISIRIPSVSQNENHPFSIASAPGHEELQVVIKVVGDWTGELRRQVENKTVCPGVMVTVFGPYGAPAQSVFKFQSVILVCGGIGVTPFASILQFFNSNLQHDGESYDHKNPIRMYQTPGRTRSMTFAENEQANYLATLQNRVLTNDVQFIWVCSDLSSLSWFTEVLQGTLHHKFFPPTISLLIHTAHLSFRHSPQPTKTNMLHSHQNIRYVPAWRATGHHGFPPCQTFVFRSVRL